MYRYRFHTVGCRQEQMALDAGKALNVTLMAVSIGALDKGGNSPTYPLQRRARPRFVKYWTACVTAAVSFVYIQWLSRRSCLSSKEISRRKFGIGGVCDPPVLLLLHRFGSGHILQRVICMEVIIFMSYKLSLTQTTLS